MTDQVEGVIEGLSAEGVLGAPAGCFWVKLDSSATTYLANVSFVLQGLKVGNRVRLELDNGRLGQMVKSVQVLQKDVGLEVSGRADESFTQPLEKNVSSQAQAPTTPLENEIKAESTPAGLSRRSEGKIAFLDLSQLAESAWNPNEMDDVTFAALIQDMRQSGIYSINSIQVFPAGTERDGSIRYQIADGHHRYRAAKKVPWNKIKCEILELDEDEAKVLNFRKNHERGSLNPDRVGKNFFDQWEKGNGKLTQDQIAEKYGVSQTYVSERLTTLKLLPGNIPSSHKEEIVHGVKDPEAQKAVARAADKHKLTRDETREIADRVSREVKVKPDASKKFLRVKAERFAREVKKARTSPNAPVEIESVFCEKCDDTFRVLHLGMNRHRVVKATDKADKEEETIE